MPRGRPPGFGGAQIGAGQPPKAVGGRQRCREAADDPVRWKAYLKAIDIQLADGVTTGFEALFRNGYGQAPQALDLRMAPVAEFRVVFDDGSPVFAEAPTVPEEPGS